MTAGRPGGGVRYDVDFCWSEWATDCRGSTVLGRPLLLARYWPGGVVELTAWVCGMIQ